MPAAEDSPRLHALRRLLAQQGDTPLGCYALALELVQLERPAEALAPLQRALELQPDLSAGWKLLGQTSGRLGKRAEAEAAYRRGIEVAEARGDVQAAREMRVFLRRLEAEP